VYKRKRILRIIDDLKTLDALMLVVWDRDSLYPRLWLREWCGAKGSVSIGTAEVIRDQIMAGLIRQEPIRPRRLQRRLPMPSLPCVETAFAD